MKDNGNKVRIHKYISDCGYTSRRKAEELVAQKKVTINGRTAKVGDKVSPGKDLVKVGNNLIKNADNYRYIVLHKPRGYVTTMSDELDRKCVAELVADVEERVYPVGRLDKDSEGLLLMTNDGDFHYAVSHPKNKVMKTYRVTVKPPATEEQLASMMDGTKIDGRETAPISVKVLQHDKRRSVLEVVLAEGRNRQIRRMCEEQNLDVARLKRTAEGSVKLGMLKQGKWRDLTEEELKMMMKITNNS